jgi:hypothetical protein
MMSNWRSSITLLLLFTNLSCNSVLSGLETASIDKTEVSQKPNCSFNVSDNCWTQSIQMISECLSPDSQGVVTNDKKFCQGTDGLLVHFLSPLQLQSDHELDFVVYKDSKKCFRVQKQGDSFSIKETPYGDIAVKVEDDGTVQVSCLFEQQVRISSEIMAMGCSDQGEEVSAPQASFARQEKENLRHFMFSFVGFGLSSQPVFNCAD